MFPSLQLHRSASLLQIAMISGSSKVKRKRKRKERNPIRNVSATKSVNSLPPVVCVCVRERDSLCFACLWHMMMMMQSFMSSNAG